MDARQPKIFIKNIIDCIIVSLKRHSLPSIDSPPGFITLKPLTNTGNVHSGLGETFPIECENDPEPEVSSLKNLKDITLNVYPNPTQSDVTIDWESGFVRISIHTLDGKEIYIKSFRDQVSSAHLLLDFKPGIYMMLLNGEKGWEEEKLLIER